MIPELAAHSYQHPRLQTPDWADRVERERGSVATDVTTPRSHELP